MREQNRMLPSFREQVILRRQRQISNFKFDPTLNYLPFPSRRSTHGWCDQISLARPALISPSISSRIAPPFLSVMKVSVRPVSIHPTNVLRCGSWPTITMELVDSAVVCRHSNNCDNGLRGDNEAIVSGLISYLAP